MLRQILVLLPVLAVAVGCEPGAQEKYDLAVTRYDRAQSRLDNLRPAYDAARDKAALVVCKEIAGTTPEESAAAALTQLEGLADQAFAGQADAGQAAAGSNADNKPIGDADAALDQLLAAHKSMQEQQSAATAPIAKTYETMKKIKTPGTPENKRFEEVFEAMPEVKAYRRQEKRVEQAKQDVVDAEAALPEPQQNEPQLNEAK